MVFEIEFTTTDVRPLFHGRDKNLISFLKPLHKNNETIFSYGKGSYLRQLGQVNTSQKNGKTFFSLQNGVKFPEFYTHRVDIKNDLSYMRKNHLRRYMTTDTYGVINRFKFGFGLELYGSKSDPSSQTSDSPISKNKISCKDIDLLLDNLLHIQTKVGKNTHSQKLPMFELGKWLAEAIERNTQLDDDDLSCNEDPDSNEDQITNQNKGLFSDWLKNKFRFISGKDKNNNDVEHVDTVAILSFYNDENVEIPDSIKRTFISLPYKENQHEKDVVSNDSNKTNTPNVTNDGNQPNKEENTKKNKGNKKKKKIKYSFRRMLEIYYYDYSIKDKKAKDNGTVRVYFIKKHSKCNPRYYHSVVNRLLDLRANLVCLENVVNKIKLTSYKQDCFLTAILDKISEIKNGELGFLNHTESDKGEVMNYSQRKKIKDKIRLYRYLVLR